MAKATFILNWKDWKNLDCSCRIDLYQGQGSAKNKLVVIATDINVGQSVTNEIETIATLVRRRENADVLDLIFIEHYEERTHFQHYRPNDRFYSESFDRVNFFWSEAECKFKSPKWSSLTHTEVYQMIGTDDIFTKPNWREDGDSNKTKRT